MRVTSHIKVSGILGLGVYAYTGETVSSVACFLSGWLIDLDHFLDWVMNFGPTLKHARVLSNFRMHRYRRLYVIFHGWEYFIGLFAFHILYGLPPWVFYATLGGACHLALDQIYNGPKRPLAYFITYRLYQRFKASNIVFRITKPAPTIAKGRTVRTDAG